MCYVKATLQEKWNIIFDEYIFIHVHLRLEWENRLADLFRVGQGTSLLIMQKGSTIQLFRKKYAALASRQSD